MGMYEYSNRSRPSHDYPEGKQNVKKKGVFLTGIQIGICAVCLAAAFLFSYFGGNNLGTAKKYVKAALSSNITNEQVVETFHSIRSQFPDAAQVFSSSGTAGKAGGAASTKSSTSTASQASKSTSSQASKASSAAPVTSGVIAKQTSYQYEGGEDLTISNLKTSSNSNLPPAAASLAPLRLSMRPVTPVSGRITSPFGYRINPITKQFSFHTGMDIAAAEGTPIAAAFAGTVEKVGVSDAYGNYVLLDNGSGIETFYGHCKLVTVHQGDKVKAGGLLGGVGSTGMSTGDHLHFEIRVHGISLNPQWIL